MATQYEGAALTFNRFIAFVAVVKQRNITRAAQELRMTQPSVSKHIKALEESYKAKLFEKTAEGLELTDEGREFFRYARAILYLLNRLQHHFESRTVAHTPEPLKVAGSYAASSVLLPSLLARFKKHHPDIPIALRTGSSRFLEQMIVNSEVEIALLNRKPNSAVLSTEPFRQERLVLCVAPNHRLARKKVVTVADLNMSSLAATGGRGRSSTTEKILKGLAEHGLNAKVTVRCATPEAVKTFVKNRVGIGVLFQDTVMPEIKKGVFKALKLPDIELLGQSYIVYSHDRPMSNNGREFLSILRQHAELGTTPQKQRQ